MPTVSNGTILVQLCSGMGAQAIAIEVPGLGNQSDEKGQHKAADQPCAFSGLTAPGLAGADPILLAIAITLIMAEIFQVEQRIVLRCGIYFPLTLQGSSTTPTYTPNRTCSHLSHTYVLTPYTACLFSLFFMDYLY